MNYLLEVIRMLDKLHSFINILLIIQTTIIILSIIAIIFGAIRGYFAPYAIKKFLIKHSIIKDTSYFIITWMYFLIFLTALGLKILLPTTDMGCRLYFNRYCGVEQSDPMYEIKFYGFKYSVLSYQLEE